jgi:type I restriction enzyme R subunit
VEGKIIVVSPEELARQNIDRLLAQAGWHVCDASATNIHAARGVAIREFPLKSGHGFADYLLYVDGKAAGVIEAKKEGVTLSGVETQSDKYIQGLPDGLPRWRNPLPFSYQSTGIETRFTNGLERPPKRGEVGVVKVSAVTWGEFDESESKTCLDKRLVNESLLIRPGDFLFSRANTIELVGACVIAEKVTSDVMLSDKILRFQLLGDLAHWVLYNLRSKFGREEIERLATGNQESMRNIGQERIRAIHIPIPPDVECRRVVAEIERRLSVVREVEVQVEANLQRAERLRQSILANCFSANSTDQVV